MALAGGKFQCQSRVNRKPKIDSMQSSRLAKRKPVVIVKNRCKVLTFRLILNPCGFDKPMPLFEFICQGCQHEFEELLRLGEQAQCPSCGSQQLERQFGAPAAHVAGKSLPMVPPQGGFCGRGTCGMKGCGDN